MKRKDIVSLLFVITGTAIFSYPYVASSYSNYQQKQLMKEYEQILQDAKIAKELISKPVEKQNKSSVATDSKDAANKHTTNKTNTNSVNSKVYNATTYNDNTLNKTKTDLSQNKSDLESDMEQPIVVDMNTVLPNLEQATKESQGDKKKADDVDDYLSRQEIIGMIEIDKIDVKLIIVEGTSWDNIRVTIGHMTQSDSIGSEGNCALAGHRGGTYGTFFKHIDQLETGDEIKVTDIEGNVFVYKMYEQFVTEPTDMSVIDDIDNESTLTLISCEDDGSRRIIVHAKLE